MIDSNLAQSRIIKNQRNSLVKQSIIGLFFVIAMLSLFIFLILPNAAKILTTIVDPSNDADELAIVPRAPIMNAPPEFVNSSRLEISGFSEIGTTVILRINGLDNSETITADNETFSSEVGLNEGENEISAVSKNEVGSFSPLSKSYLVVLDTASPELVINDLEDGASFVGREQRVLHLSGKTKPESKVTINDRFLFSRMDGTFQYDYSLNEGDNTIQIQATDRAGNTVSQSFHVTFRL